MLATLLHPPVLLCCAAAFAATAGLTRRAWAICGPLGLIDEPDPRKQHTKPTPLLGGLALAGIVLPLALLATWFEPVSSDISLLWLGLTATAVTFVGLADDRHDLNPRLRVTLGFAIFSGLALFDRTFLIRQLQFPLLGFNFGLYWDVIALFFTALCCVGLVNAVNMADGKNGLVTGLSTGWLMLILGRSSPGDIPFMLVITAGLIALLVMNLRGRLFLGDGGAYGLAAAIGLLTIRAYTNYLHDPTYGLSAEAVVLLFLVPVADSFRLTFRRLAQGRSPMSPDRDHLHHHLQARYGWPGGLIVYLTLALAPAAILIFFGL